MEMGYDSGTGIESDELIALFTVPILNRPTLVDLV
jgi:hypothetical protein